MFNKINLNDKIKIVKDGEPCDHVGCQSHISQPCELCGRFSCNGEAHYNSSIDNNNKTYRRFTDG